jgi:hypothetical protein
VRSAAVVSTGWATVRLALVNPKIIEAPPPGVVPVWPQSSRFTSRPVVVLNADETKAWALRVQSPVISPGRWRPCVF